MSWTDDEIDKLFRDNDSKMTFEYSDDYWKEMEMLLPEKKTKGNVLWFLTAGVFLIGMGGMLLFERLDSVSGHEQLADISEIELSKITAKPSNYQQIIGDVKTDILSTANHGVKKDLNFPYLSNSQSNVATEKQTEVNSNKQDKGINSSFAEQESEAIGQLSALSELYLNKKALQRKEYDLIPLKDFTPSNAPWAKQVFVELNSGISQSWITPSEKIGISAGIGGGVHFQKNNFGFITGVYASVLRPGDLYLTRTAKVYSFGSDVYAYNFNFQQIYQFEALLSARYSLGRHAFSLGVRPTLMLGSKVRMTSLEPYSTMSSGGSGFSDLSEVRNVNGYLDGLKRFRFRPMIGYSVGLNSGMEMGVNIGAQIAPLVDESFINGVNRAYSLEGQLYIRKSIGWK